MMRSILAASLSVLAVTAVVHAHHIWIVPASVHGTFNVYFSDFLEPGGAQTLKKIAHTTLWVRQLDGKDVPLTWQKRADAFAFKVPADRSSAVGGVCIYGVERHDHRLQQEVEPYLLAYYPKAIIGDRPTTTPWNRLPLEIMSTRTGNEVRLQVLFRGKPVAGAELYIHPPEETREEMKADEKGEATVSLNRTGVYGFRTRYVEDRAGEHLGTKYVEVRHYASLVMARGIESDEAK